MELDGKPFDQKEVRQICRNINNLASAHMKNIKIFIAKDTKAVHSRMVQRNENEYDSTMGEVYVTTQNKIFTLLGRFLGCEVIYIDSLLCQYKGLF